MRTFLHKWGEYLLALMFVTVIIFAALYTRQDDLVRFRAENAAANNSQTLEEAQKAPAWQLPCTGKITRFYAGAVKSGYLWKFDPYVHFEVRVNQRVFATGDGTVTETNGESIAIAHENGLVSVLLGVKQPLVKAGDSVQGGQEIALCLGKTLRLSIKKNASYVDPLTILPYQND